jgi:hypothetical protein
LVVGTVCGLAGCSRNHGGQGVDVPSSDAAWVASACQPVSIDTTGWRRYRLGDVTIQVPPQYTPTRFAGYDFAARGPGGTVWMQLHRNARYTWDGINVARRGQNWCNGSLGGNQAEILAWFEPFSGQRRDTRVGELILAATYNFAARLPASWGGQDEGKWLFIYIGASRLRDAHALRDALHTLRPVRDSGNPR